MARKIAFIGGGQHGVEPGGRARGERSSAGRHPRVGARGGQTPGPRGTVRGGGDRRQPGGGGRERRGGAGRQAPDHGRGGHRGGGGRCARAGRSSSPSRPGPGSPGSSSGSTTRRRSSGPCRTPPPSSVAGATALFANEAVTGEQREAAETILESAGIALWVDDEDLLDAVTAVSGSGPAYYFLLMEHMIEAGARLRAHPRPGLRPHPPDRARGGAHGA